MSIEITIVKSPPGAHNPKLCQIFTERGGTIGRGPDNTWTLEDPERFISTRHTQIHFENGQYYLSDISTNGTFINGASEPIGNGNRVLLKDGDRFNLGDYEFLVSMRAHQGTPSFDDNPFGASSYASGGMDIGAGQDGFNPSFPAYDDPFAVNASAGSPVTDALISSGYEEKDPLAVLDKMEGRNQPNPFIDSFGALSQPDNADPLQQAVAWPSAIPDDWDEDDISLHKAEPVPVQKQPTRAEPAEHAIVAQLRNSEQRRNVLELENEQLMTDIMQLKQMLANLNNSPARSCGGRNVTASDETLIAALGLGGFKLSSQKKIEISEIAGKLVRETLLGLMQTLGFRKKIKEEFRINVTTIQPVENNPLKFSANIEDALENMFIKENKAYMKPLDAVREGFQGISEHQISVLAGIQAGFRGMIERLDPESLESRFEKYRKAGMIKMGQKGKNWDSYKEFHQDLVNNFDNSFQYLFGYDFVQAYEDQLQRLILSRKAKTKAKN